MAKVTGLGGVFYVVEDPAATRAWYRDTLGIDGEYGPQLDWAEETGEKPYSLISHFTDNEYIKPGTGQPINGSMVDFWPFVEFLPRRIPPTSLKKGPKAKGVYFPLFDHRRIPPDATIHPSVGERMKLDAYYRPPGLEGRDIPRRA